MMRKKHSIFTPEELAELEAFDREVDESRDYDPDEIAFQKKLDSEFRIENREEERRVASKRAFTPEQTERNSELKKAHYLKHREESLAYSKAYYAQNTQALSEYKKSWYKQNRERILNHQKAYRDKKKADKPEIVLDENSPYSLRLKKWRLDNGYTQAEAAKLFCTAKSSISNYERGLFEVPDYIKAEISE